MWGCVGWLALWGGATAWKSGLCCDVVSRASGAGREHFCLCEPLAGLLRQSRASPPQYAVSSSGCTISARTQGDGHKAQLHIVCVSVAAGEWSCMSQSLEGF